MELLIAARFDFAFEGGATLSVADIWPDGDAPENPTVEDVRARVAARWTNVSDLIRDWNFERDVALYVNSERVLP